MRRRRVAWVVAGSLFLVGGAVFLSLGGDERVWCQMNDAGGIRSIREWPDGRVVTEGAWMTAEGAAWAYYYNMTGSADVEAEARRAEPAITYLLATGRETSRPSGAWREFRVSPREEFECVFSAWERRVHAER
jgi:hypothetical protein